MAEKIIHTGLAALLICGLLATFGNSFACLYAALKARRRLVKRDREKKRSGILKHLDPLVRATLPNTVTSEMFLSASVVIFVSAAATGLRSAGFAYSLTTAFIFAAAPYLLMRIRLEGLRRKSSHEGETFLSCLLSAYRLSGGNIAAAVEALAADDNMPEHCRRLMPEIVANMRMVGNASSLRNCAAGFAYGVNTNWSRITAYNIGMAAATGMDISLALENILSQLKEARALAEERRRLNSESVRLVIFMVPAAYMGTLLLSLNYLNMDISTLVRNQFFTTEGFMMITVSLFLFIFNVALLAAVNNRQFDF